MSENEKMNYEAEMEQTGGNGYGNEEAIDLGSDTFVSDPFEDDNFLAEFQPQENTQQKHEIKKPSQHSQNAETEKKPKEREPQGGINPLEAELDAVAAKDAETAQKSLFAKAPVFDYGGAIEEIEDSSKTFEELRIEKATDFPELDEGKRVSWTVEYGKTVKSVTDPKGTTIGKIKSDIEKSKDFMDNLKKSKDKNPTCKVKPKITAQSKGTIPAYKGVYCSKEAAESSGKLITIFPVRSGKVMEMRRMEMGAFITPTTDCALLDEVEAGFFPALPLVPDEMLQSIVSFFRHYMNEGAEYEALVNLYWDKENMEFVINPPLQTVTKASIEASLNDEFSNDRYIHYMDIHSHNSMNAFFSKIDDQDEKATRLYAVIGRLDNLFPDIKVRTSNGGKFLEIEPNLVFDLDDENFPVEWANSVVLRKSHSDDMEWANSLMGRFGVKQRPCQEDGEDE